MIVPDASSVALCHIADERSRQARAELKADPHWVVPEHWMVETISVFRGLAAGGKMTEEQATAAVWQTTTATVAVTSTATLAARIWELRHNLTAYDAAYVAVAEAHGATLVTADGRIAKARVARCPIITIA